MKTLFTALLCGGTFLLSAQVSSFWRVTFRDKPQTSHSLTRPTEFLSERSLARRQKQGIATDTTDLPVSNAYLQAIAPYTDSLLCVLKWSNSAIILPKAGINPDSLLSLPMVISAMPVTTLPVKSNNRPANKFAEEQFVPMNYAEDGGKYGASYRQINQLNLDLLHARGFEGEGMMVAVMDNGFFGVDQYTAFDSLRLSGRITATRDFVAKRKEVFDIGGHGTSVLSCLAAILPGQLRGSAPYAEYLLLASEDDNAETVMEEYYWAAAAEFADSMGADVLSTSLGYTSFDNGEGDHAYSDMDGNSTVISRASNMAAGKGMLVLNSAGNSGRNSWKYISAPADAREIIAVGAVDATEQIADFSSYGPSYSAQVKPDACAMGRACTLISRDGFLSNGSGTSFACPILAGGAACLWQALPGHSAIQIRDLLRRSGSRFENPNDRFGYGIPDLYAAWLSETRLPGFPFAKNIEPLLYPNPSGGSCSMMIYAPIEGTYSIELISVNGQRGGKMEVFLRESSSEWIALDPLTDKLPKGEYLLKVSPNARLSHLKLILN